MTVKPMRLCAGTLEVEHPDQVLLDYLDVRNGYAYPAYDRLVTNGSAELVDGDLLAPALMGVHLDARPLRACCARCCRRSRPSPTCRDVALQDADDDHVYCVAGLFGILDEPRYAGRGIRGTIVSQDPAPQAPRPRPDLRLADLRGLHRAGRAAARDRPLLAAVHGRALHDRCATTCTPRPTRSRARAAGRRAGHAGHPAAHPRRPGLAHRRHLAVSAWRAPGGQRCAAYPRQRPRTRQELPSGPSSAAPCAVTCAARRRPAAPDALAVRIGGPVPHATAAAPRAAAAAPGRAVLANDDIGLTVGQRRGVRAARPERRRQDARSSASSSACCGPTPGASSVLGHDLARRPRRSQPRLLAYLGPGRAGAARAAGRPRRRDDRPAARAVAARRPRRARRRAGGARARPRSPAGRSARCPAGSGGWPRSRPRWSASGRCWCSTSRRPASTRPPAAPCSTPSPGAGGDAA